jgi:hypothetical protein
MSMRSDSTVATPSAAPPPAPSAVCTLSASVKEIWNNKRSDCTLYKYTSGPNGGVIGSVTIQLPNKPAFRVQDTIARINRAVSQEHVAKLALERLEGFNTQQKSRYGSQRKHKQIDSVDNQKHYQKSQHRISPTRTPHNSPIVKPALPEQQQTTNLCVSTTPRNEELAPVYTPVVQNLPQQTTAPMIAPSVGPQYLPPQFYMDPQFHPYEQEFMQHQQYLIDEQHHYEQFMQHSYPPQPYYEFDPYYPGYPFNPYGYPPYY